MLSHFFTKSPWNEEKLLEKFQEMKNVIYSFQENPLRMRRGFSCPSFPVLYM
ncbi:hypothetical protein B4113_4052 [Geobacillus sp. B4113_201601]|nr:hypothetical protein B4113_4052 [Geobacillus sp. B4113_201601]